MENRSVPHTTITFRIVRAMVPNEKYRSLGICRHYQQVILTCPRYTVEAATLVIVDAGLCEQIIKYTRVRVAITLHMERY